MTIFNFIIIFVNLTKKKSTLSPYFPKFFLLQNTYYWCAPLMYVFSIIFFLYFLGFNVDSFRYAGRSSQLSTFVKPKNLLFNRCELNCTRFACQNKQWRYTQQFNNGPKRLSTQSFRSINVVYFGYLYLCEHDCLHFSPHDCCSDIESRNRSEN